MQEQLGWKLAHLLAFVQGQAVEAREVFVAAVTPVGALASVPTLVAFQGRLLAEAFPALVAAVRLLACVGAQVEREAVLLVEAHGAPVALVGSFLGVVPHVHVQACLLSVSLGTPVTPVGPAAVVTVAWVTDRRRGVGVRRSDCCSRALPRAVVGQSCEERHSVMLLSVHTAKLYGLCQCKARIVISYFS